MSVEVRFLGHLGNNLFQYALGRVLAEERGLALRCLPASETPGFGEIEQASGIVDRLEQVHEYFADAPLSVSGRDIGQPQRRYVMGEKPGWNGHGLPFDHLMRDKNDHRIVLHGYFQRIEYYHPHRERIRRWFRLQRELGAPEPGPRDVILHLRQSLDMKLLERALGLDYYVSVLSSLSCEKVYVCGLGLYDPEVRSALAPWNPIWLNLSAVDTLALMTRFRRIVMANSTFSWWGAYLAPQAEVFFPRPLRGCWGLEWPEVSLEVPEERYRYVDDVPARSWRPWRWISNLNWALGEQAGALVLVGPPGAPQWGLPSALGPSVQWILTTHGEPFGLEDLFAHGLPAHARPVMLELLVALAQAGAVHADSEWMNLALLERGRRAVGGRV